MSVHSVQNPRRNKDGWEGLQNTQKGAKQGAIKLKRNAETLDEDESEEVDIFEEARDFFRDPED